MKKYLSILLILMIFFVSGTSAFAMELPDETKNSRQKGILCDICKCFRDIFVFI